MEAQSEKLEFPSSAPSPHVERFFRKPTFGLLSKIKAIFLVFLNAFAIWCFLQPVSSKIGLGVICFVAALFFARRLVPAKILLVFSFPFGSLARALENFLYRAALRRYESRLERGIEPFLSDIQKYSEGLREKTGEFNPAFEEVESLQIYLKRKGYNLPLAVILELMRRESFQHATEKMIEKLLDHAPELARNHSLDVWISAYATYATTDDEKTDLQMLAAICESRALIFQKHFFQSGPLPYIAAALKRIREQNSAERKFQNAKSLIEGEQSKRITLTDVDQQDGHEFEKFLEGLFRDMGFQVRPTRQTGDQGADLIIQRAGTKTVVQAKRLSEPVGNYSVQEVVAARGFYKCDEAIVISNQIFTKAAIELAQANRVALWDRTMLAGLLFQFPQAKRSDKFAA